MPKSISAKNLYSPENLNASYQNCDKLIEFLKTYRGPKNDNSGKYGIPLNTVHHLFNETWKNLGISSGHIKLQHTITQVVVNYKNHDNDPVDPGAVESLAEQIQKHINLFYDEYLGYSTWKRHSTKPDFSLIAKKLNAKFISNKIN